MAMVLDRPLVDAQALVCDPFKPVDEILQIEEKQSHPVMEQMVKPDVRDGLREGHIGQSSSGQTRLTRNPTQPKEHYGEYQQLYP